MMLDQSHLNGRAYLMIITGEDLMKFSPPDGYEVATKKNATVHRHDIWLGTQLRPVG